jgi:hypothetical protein
MFDNFISELRKVKCTSGYINQYSPDTEYSEITVKNLKKYLEHIYSLNPEYIFIGEAPGYNGCRITGIPFTDEIILTQNFGNGIFGKENGYQIINEDKPRREPTAQCIWQTFNEYKRLTPCFWNAFPFHPHEINSQKNRTPNAEELRKGRCFLEKYIEIFEENNKKIKYCAIGRKAERILKNMDINCVYVRHPAKGGKKEFICGIRNLYKNIK